MARKEFEVWENKNRSEIWVNKTNPLRGDIESVPVRPRGRVEITTEDRIRYNQEAAYDKAHDWFSNGALSQVHLIESAEDYEEIISNPNTKSESEIKQMLKLPTNQFKKELAEVTSPLVLQRMKEYVESDEAEKADISVAKQNAVFNRFAELHPDRTGKRFDSYEESVAKPITLKS